MRNPKKLLKQTHLLSVAKLICRKKLNMLFAGLGSVRVVRNCYLGLENATFGLRPRAAFSSWNADLFVTRVLTVINASAAVTLLEQRPEKNLGSERDSNPRPLRCQCSALPTELSKPHESGRMRVSPLNVDVILGPSIVGWKLILSISSNCVLTVINASAAVTLLEQRPEKNSGSERPHLKG